ncbi:hypothetical protein DVR12_23600 [Chitinophaga silvatica]|uniref:PKD-like family protein n=1 Tax=Chitinophaga silvatica TaxID=2282649 RepID=A0A3E1Y3L7_9BACT|nr:PKD-like family lipoprotein [Chitinophaga silvatica]RFS19226.1 hypothetical protein DVR12_23600 [Chitinophaga silvatica]
MKRIYIFLAVMTSFAAASCTKDKSTGFTSTLPAFGVSGIKDTINVFTHQDTLRISPQVLDSSLYDFYWTNISGNFVSVNGNKNVTDTLARTRELNYVVMLDPGPYYLVFNIRDKKSGVIKLVPIYLNVSTLNNDGWYLVKDNNGKTEMDFIHKAGRIDNWIATYNNGKSLEGNAVDAVFAPNMRPTLTSANLYGGLVVISDKDAGIYRVSNGQATYSFDSMFFSKPANRKPQRVFQPQNMSNLMLINDNKAYCMTKGTLFTDLPQTYKPSPQVAVGSMEVGWDLTTKSIMYFNATNYANMGSNGPDLKNMTSDLIWSIGYPGTRSVAMLLFKMPDGNGMLYKMNTLYQFLNGSEKALIMVRDTLDATHGLLHANVIGGNYDSDYLYYAIGNNIYMTDVTTVTERLQITLPEGETVTAIQHVKYPVPTSGVSSYTTDYLAVASYKANRYKVWLYKLTSTGTIQPLAQPTFEGDGRVKRVIYMQQGQGSRVF